ncbi:STAS domain-containing protein [Mycobacterium sp. SMC-4]|uniref:STAS domain-containing protein n=1 Tax=Mycobacterium sp. SMC-4 TaxID=2857059 RepID=UPI0021B27F9D|nr:STAS domain-containing protein [Mycobacterium sp. SMC-4]UXA18546.1 STAS domain-containing protein [Mycobacterium sp. SMC-4]
MSYSESLPAPSTQRVFRPDPTSFALREEHHRATFSVSEVTPSTVVVTVHGEIDATNAVALARYIERHLGSAATLTLDLQTVEFFGTAGFAALTNINVACERAGLRWTLLAGAHVNRLLRICDPDNELPVAATAKYIRTGPGNRKLLVGGDH